MPGEISIDLALRRGVAGAWVVVGEGMLKVADEEGGSPVLFVVDLALISLS
jgi:hypothetical protein